MAASQFDDEEYIGHFKLKLLEFSATSLEFEIVGHAHNRVEVSFALTAAEFEKTRPIVEVIFGLREPDYDELMMRFSALTRRPRATSNGSSLRQAP